MARIKEYEKLNSTGSLLKHIPTNTIYSYSTPIYQEFCTRKGLLKVFNDTYYSSTTRKHQANIRDYETQSDIVFHYCPYGKWSLDAAFKNEITMIRCEIDKLNEIPHKLGKRQAKKLKELITKLKYVQNLYKEI